MTRHPLAAYAVTASLTRSGVEAAGPGVLVAVVALGGSLRWAAIVVACLTAAAAVAGPVVGTVLDRTAKPGRGITVSVALLATSLTVLALVLLELPAVWALPVALVAGLGQPATTGAWTAQLPWVVPGDRLGRALAVDAGTYNLAALIGPAIATGALVIAPVAPVLVAVALLGIGLLTLPAVPLGTRERSGPVRPRWADVVEGLRGLVGTTGLRWSTTVTTIGFAGQAAVIVAAPLVSQRLTGGLGFTGVLLAVMAVGGLASSVVLARRPVRAPDESLVVAQAVIAAGMVGIGLAPGGVGVLVAALVLGAGDTLLITAMFEIRARDTAPELRARVFTTGASLRTFAFAVATAAFGMASDAGAAAVLAIGAAVQLLALLAGRAAAGSWPGSEPVSTTDGATPPH